MDRATAAPDDASAVRPIGGAGRGPLAGLKVLDFGHTVMGPTAGLVLADLGATVVRVEPVDGDPTRWLKGFGAGFFAYFNRNKGSVALDLKAPDARPAVEAALGWADVLIENFAPGTMDRLGLGPDAVRALNPRLVYCSLKGFLPGPYESRTALDEVAQMMGGLAYMTGPRGKPMRAGASVTDITGGVFGIVAVLAALIERERTGRGALVQSALFESVAFLVGQHMAVTGMTGRPTPPMAERIATWGVYDVVDCRDGQVFLAVTSDRQWPRFATAFGLGDLLADPLLATNAGRCEARDRLIPAIRAVVSARTLDEVSAMAEGAGIPFAPIREPAALFEDGHLVRSGSLLPVEVEGRRMALPALPLRIDGRPPVASDPPVLGADTRAMLATWGLDPPAIDRLIAAGAARSP